MCGLSAVLSFKATEPEVIIQGSRLVKVPFLLGYKHTFMNQHWQPDFWKTLTDSEGGRKHIHHEANWCKRAVGGQRFSVADWVAIIWMSYKIQPDPINMPLDRRASHQPNLENQ